MIESKNAFCEGGQNPYTALPFKRLRKTKNSEDVPREDLKAAIVEAWNSIPQETIDKIIGSFRKRLRHVILEKGGAIQRFEL